MILRMVNYEWHKWRVREDGFYLALALLVAAPLYGLALQALIKSGVLSGQVFSLINLEQSGYQLAFRVTRDLMMVLGVVLLIWASTTIAGEREQRTLRLSLLRIRRSEISLAKLLFLSVLGLVLAIGIFALALGVATWAFGLHGVEAAGLTLHSGADLLISGLIATGLTLLPLGAALTLGLFISTFARSAQTGMILALGTATVLWLVGQIPGADPYIFSSTFNWPFQVALSHSEGLQTLTFTGDLLRHCILNLLWIGGLLVLTRWVFQKKDQN